MLEILRQDYVRTARAKGLAERAVVLRHALKNALIPIVTVVGVQAGYLLGGADPHRDRVRVARARHARWCRASWRATVPLVQGGVLRDRADLRRSSTWPSICSTRVSTRASAMSERPASAVRRGEPARRRAAPPARRSPRSLAMASAVLAAVLAPLICRSLDPDTVDTPNRLRPPADPGHRARHRRVRARPAGRAWSGAARVSRCWPAWPPRRAAMLVGVAPRGARRLLARLGGHGGDAPRPTS